MKVPIGLVHSSWGGSQVESWISKDAMFGSDELKSYAEKLPSDWAGFDALLERNVKKATLGIMDANSTIDDEKKYLRGGFRRFKMGDE